MKLVFVSLMRDIERLRPRLDYCSYSELSSWSSGAVEVKLIRTARTLLIVEVLFSIIV